MPMAWPSISSLPSRTWLVLYVAISLQLMACHTTKNTTTDEVQLRDMKLQQTDHQNLALDMWDICRWDILDSAGKPAGSIIQNRHTETKVHTADTTQMETTDTIKNHQSKTTNRNVSALPDVSEKWYYVIMFVCACIMLIAVIRILKI